MRRHEYVKSGARSRLTVAGAHFLCLLCVAAAVRGQDLRIVSFNLNNYLAGEAGKPAASRAAVIEMLAELDADIALLLEVGGSAVLREITAALAGKGKPYPFSTVVQAVDEERFITLIAKRAPVTVEHETRSAYNIKGQTMLVKRGFVHCVFEPAEGYRLHIIGAHFKSKVFHPLGQTDMRRYESRQLRYLIDRVLEQEPEANLLVAGDFNDSPDSSPLNTLFSRRSRPALQLFDLRPVDRFGLAWTHFWDEADAYSRIDYALVSHGLLPEVVFEQTCLPVFDGWEQASDHRPLVITVRAGERELDASRLSLFRRNIRMPR